MSVFPAQLMEQLLEDLRNSDRDRYLCLLLMPEHARGYLAGLYAFNSELAQIRERVTDPAAGEVRLEWWNQVIDAIYVGQTVDSPLAQALARTIEAGDLPRHAFRAMLEARRFDLFDDPMPDLNTLEGYLGETSSAVLQMSALIMAGDDGLECSEVSGLAGVAMGLTGLLRSLPIHRARGQCMLPADMLAKHDLTQAHVLSNKGGAGLELVLLQLCRHANKRLEEAREKWHLVPDAAVKAYLPVALVPSYLKKLERSRASLMKKVITSPQWMRQLRLLNAVRSEAI
ncbi:MAG: phytoene/squalene synthase family protein [Pseudomonadota bacterium]